MCCWLASDLRNRHQLKPLQELCSSQQQAIVKELYLIVLKTPWKSVSVITKRWIIPFPVMILAPAPCCKT